MGFIRKSLRVATLPLGPAGVKGSSKKQRVAKATLRAQQGDPVAARRLAVAEAQLSLAKAQLRLAVRKANQNKIAQSEVDVAAAELKIEELRNY